MNCLFCKIAHKELDSHILYEDNHALAFTDIDPKAPKHILIIPKKHIETLNDVAEEDQSLLGHLIIIAKNLAREFEIAEDGYRVVLNCNKNGGQAVFHLHVHLLGGRTMHWPPG